MKRIRRPLTDINGCDFMTGQKVEPVAVEQEIKVKERIDKWMEQKIKESTVEGKIHVEGLGWVKVENITVKM